MAADLPTLVSEIDALVARIAVQIARLPPDQLLHRAWWEFATAMLGLGPKGIGDSGQADAMRMIDYVQSIIASVKPNEPYAEEVSEEDWSQLTEDVRKLFVRLTLEYQICLTAHRRAMDSDLDMALEEFRFRSEVLWMNVRGKRYQAHERQALLDVLTPHSDVLIRLFGIDVSTLVGELDEILKKLTSGLGDTLFEYKRFCDDTQDALGKLSETTGIADVEVLYAMLFRDAELAARRDKVLGEFLGTDLFDVEKVTRLPKSLVDELTWSLGEDGDFFAPGEYPGWPLRVWPTMKRPFIRLNGRVLCFDLFGLFDNLYRVLQRVIFRLVPDYKGTWNDRQKAVSEELPFAYLGRLLPGARVYRSVYYRWKAGDGPPQWHEADGLVIYDDHLFIIEVKAGAFTYTSPATDLAAHIASLENLVRSPASQGSRFVDYLESADEVQIADAGHVEIGQLRRSDFRHVTVCAVTLDAFTELAARAQHLRRVGVDVGRRSVWVLSIDDLRAYADLFDNPLVFLHFAEQRMRAARSSLVDLDDEMDHLGLYIAHNDYSQHAANLVGAQTAKLAFHGFRKPIDEYYSALVRGELATVPRQKIPTRMAEVISFLASSVVPGRAALASFLLDSPNDLREMLGEAIERQLRENIDLARARPLSTYGDVRLTLYSWSPSVPRHANSAVEHTRTVVAADGEKSRVLIELEYSAEGVLRDVHWQRVDLSGLPVSELGRFRAAGETLRQRRVTAALRERGKIGPNDPCPCGSEKRYKRCCRR